MELPSPQRVAWPLQLRPPTNSEDTMRRGNGGEALRDHLQEGLRAVGDGIEHTVHRVRRSAVDVGGRAVDFTREHPFAIAGSLVAGVGIGFLIARMFQR